MRTKDDGQYTHRLKLRIESVELIRHAAVQCISIAHPSHLYVTNDFVVTHNTITATVTAAEIQKRLCVLTLSRFIDKWKKDIDEVYEVVESDICAIRGGDALINASHWVSGGAVEKTPLPPVFLLSIETFMVWIKKYIEDAKSSELDMYGCDINHFFESLGIGTVIIDEVHMSLHQVFQIYCFMNVDWIINLSATVLSKDQIVSRIQKMMFPRYARFEEIEMKKYITCYACSYQINDFRQAKVNTTEYGSNRYSHSAFETSILKNKLLGKSYMQMLVKMVVDTYHRNYIEGDKLAIFVYQQNTARLLRDLLQAALPQYDTRTYLLGDAYANIFEADIIITTAVKAGAAVDIPNLRVVIQTVSVDSPVTNLQVLGRLRELKDRDVHHYYLYCMNVQKQIEYHRGKVDLYRPRVKDIQTVIMEPLSWR
jgi:hypothetical protein